MKKHWILVVVYAGLLLWGLGRVHLFDWDEINFAECAREMGVSGNYQQVQIDFRPFLEKPPLFIWLQALSMHVFGSNEFAARFPNAVLGVVLPIILFWFGRRWFNPTFGWLWAMSYAGSILPLFYFKSGIIDPWFNAFMFLGLAGLMEYQRSGNQRYGWLIMAAITTGLAVLTKGPVGVLIVGGVAFIYTALDRFRLLRQWRQVVLAIMVFIVTGGSWFIYQGLTGQSQLMLEFIAYQVRLFTTQDAGHGGFPFYHVVVLWFGVFPAAIFALPAFKKMWRQMPDDYFRWMSIAFWLVLILFSITKTKIVHYSSFCYLPLTFLAAHSLHERFHLPNPLLKWQKNLLVVQAGVWVLVVIGLQWVGLNTEQLSKLVTIRDPFAEASLAAEVSWSGWEWLITLPLILAIVVIYKKIVFLRQLELFYGLVFLFTLLTMHMLVPRIEGYSQRAAIEFYKQHAAEDADITALEYKSYAHLFYGRRRVENQATEPKEAYIMRLTSGDIHRPAYFVTVNRKWTRIKDNYPQLTVLGEKNGFVFLVRYPEH